MPIYYYKAITKNGLIVRNKVEDVSRITLMRKLKKNGLTPLAVIQTTKSKMNKMKTKRNTAGMSEIMKSAATTHLKKQQDLKKQSLRDKFYSFIARSKGVKLRDILIFTQNFYLLKKANFNNIHALSTIIQNTESPVFKEILSDILAGVESGENIYTTMEYYEGIFPYIYISMIKSGELSGSLTETLFQAINYLEETMDLNKKIRSILIPNIIQFITIFVLLIGGTLYAIPMVQDVFDSVGTKDTLPPITLWFSGVVDGFMNTWYIYACIVLAIIGGIVWYINTPNGRYNFDYFKYKGPIFGSLVYAIDFSRFMNAVLLNVRSGIRVQDALENSKNTAHNLVLLSIIETSINNVLIGRSWIEPFENSGLSSPMATEMLKIGMQTDLTVMLEKLIEYMKQDIDVIMTRVMKALPQVVYAIVGVLLIFFVVVVLVPMIQVYFGTFLFSAAGV